MSYVPVGLQRRVEVCLLALQAHGVRSPLILAAGRLNFAVMPLLTSTFLTSVKNWSSSSFQSLTFQSLPPGGLSRQKWPTKWVPTSSPRPARRSGPRSPPAGQPDG
ncbi:MAG: hypothetical protein ACR2M5_06805 [Nakamurella sp.]